MTNKRHEFEQRIENQLARIETQLVVAKAQLAQDKDDAAAALKSQLADLEASRDELRQKLASLRETAGDAWEDTSLGVSKAWRDIKSAYNEFEKGLAKAYETVTS